MDTEEYDHAEADAILNHLDGTHTHIRPKMSGGRSDPIHQSPYSHKNVYKPNAKDFANKVFMGGASGDYDGSTDFFLIEQRDTDNIQISLFAHHETAFINNGTWLAWFTLIEIGVSVAVALLATMLVSGIVDTYHNGILWFAVIIPIAVLAVLQLGCILKTWAAYSSYSHMHNNAVILPVFYYILSYLLAGLALGYWVNTYQADLTGTYDVAAAPAAERPYFYAVYTLLAVVALTTIPDLIGSVLVQRYPERKLYILKDERSDRPSTYYITANGDPARIDLNR